MNKILILTMALLISMAGRAHAGPITITNPGFETVNFSGWTTTPIEALFGVRDFSPHSGILSAVFGESTVGSYDAISQTLTTTPGDVVDVTFWLQNEDGGTNDFQALWNGAVVFDRLNAGAFPYTLQSFIVPATSSSSTLTFRAYNQASFFYLDDVSATESLAAVPEPTSLTLMALGLAGLAARLRRRRTGRI